MTRSKQKYTRALVFAFAAAVVAAGCSSSQPEGAQTNGDGGVDATTGGKKPPSSGDDDDAATNEDGGLGDDEGGALCAEAGVCAADGCREGITLCDGTCGSLVNAPNGTACGANGVCESGTCVPCTPGNACSPSAAPCDNGTLTCSLSGATCVDQHTTAAPGTACGAASAKTFCDPNGLCDCQAGAACKLTTNVCHIGVTSCTTTLHEGVAECIDSGSSLLNGAPCGTGLACSFGACVPITCSLTTADGGVSSCVPANPCDQGTVAACPAGEFGPPTCTDTGVPVAAGVTCNEGGTCNGDGGCTP